MPETHSRSEEHEQPIKITWVEQLTNVTRHTHQNFMLNTQNIPHPNIDLTKTMLQKQGSTFYIQ